MITFIFSFVIVIVVFLAFMSASDIGGWQEVKYHNYKWKRFFQDQGFIKKDIDYAMHMRDVYHPTRKRLDRERNEKLITEKTLSHLYSAIAENKMEIEFDFYCDGMSNRDICHFALEVVKKAGYKEAYTGNGYPLHAVSIELGPKS